ncbi:MAG TPA: hypothetical protein PK760_05310, partial [Flavobacteriales bacterium]|nr:hypothetical protein [Flavobacteriales bacterium]
SAIIFPSTPAVVTHDPPALNQRIIAYVDAHMSKKVDRGECWDLAAGALNKSGAKWDGLYGFGKVVDWRKEEIMPGDIVQFEGVEVEHREGNSIQRDSYGKHTAIVYTVNERGDYIIAHQNFGELGRKVSTTGLRMADVRGGKLVFYRPVE